MASPSENETIPDLRIVCTLLGTLQYKYHDIGVALGVPEYKLMEFKNRNGSPFSATIDYWLKGNCEGVSVRWETLVKALSSDYVAEIGLANTIQAKYCPHYCSTEDQPMQRNVPDGPSVVNQQAEKPAFSEAEQKEKYRRAKPENLPDEGTDKHCELERFSKEVMIILQTVNKNEYRAALTYMKPPTDQFSHAVIFPMTSMVVGFFAGKKTALIQAKPGAKVGNFVQDAIMKYPNARFMIGIGVCYSFNRQKYKLADVLVSETISDNINKKFTAQGEIENRGQTIDVVYALTKIFCMEEDEDIGYVVSDAGREAKVYPGKFCCDPCLMDDKVMRRKYLHANPRAIGGEMEGGELMKFDRSGKIEGVIVIKGVADYGDGTKDKSWQFIASMAALHYTESQLRNVPSKELCPALAEVPEASRIDTDGPSED